MRGEDAPGPGRTRRGNHQSTCARLSAAASRRRSLPPLRAAAPGRLPWPPHRPKHIVRGTSTGARGLGPWAGLADAPQCVPAATASTPGPRRIPSGTSARRPQARFRFPTARPPRAMAFPDAAPHARANAATKPQHRAQIAGTETDPASRPPPRPACFSAAAPTKPHPPRGRGEKRLCHRRTTCNGNPAPTISAYLFRHPETQAAPFNEDGFSLLRNTN
jgi:hypothetical protein